MSTSLHSVRFPGEREPYRQARDELLRAEIDLRTRLEEVAAMRRRLPLGGELREDYVFEEGTPDLDDSHAVRTVRMSELFRPGEEAPALPLPVPRLARLAVDSSARRRGLGRALHRFVLQLAIRTSNDYGCVGVLVDAKPDAIEFYRKYGFIPLDLVEGQSEVRPQPTAMFRSTRAILDALGTAHRPWPRGADRKTGDVCWGRLWCWRRGPAAPRRHRLRALLRRE